MMLTSYSFTSRDSDLDCATVLDEAILMLGRHAGMLDFQAAASLNHLRKGYDFVPANVTSWVAHEVPALCKTLSRTTVSFTCPCMHHIT
jgi:hypothetical protein